jgi:hypothetical protein
MCADYFSLVFGWNPAYLRILIMRARPKCVFVCTTASKGLQPGLVQLVDVLLAGGPPPVLLCTRSWRRSGHAARALPGLRPNVAGAPGP